MYFCIYYRIRDEILGIGSRNELRLGSENCCVFLVIGNIFVFWDYGVFCFIVISNFFKVIMGLVLFCILGGGGGCSFFFYIGWGNVYVVVFEV